MHRFSWHGREVPVEVGGEAWCDLNGSGVPLAVDTVVVEEKNQMATRFGGQGRVSTKSKLADELIVMGKVLVRVREGAKIKQSDVAAKLGVPPSWLSKVESGTRRLDVIELIRIAEAMGHEPSHLIEQIRLALVPEER